MTRVAAFAAALVSPLSSCYWVGNPAEVNLISTEFDSKADIDQFLARITYETIGYTWRRLVGRTVRGNEDFPQPDKLEYIMGHTGARDQHITISVYEGGTVSVVFFGDRSRDDMQAEGAWLKAFVVSTAPEGVRFKNIRTGQYEPRIKALPKRPEWPACQAQHYQPKCD